MVRRLLISLLIAIPLLAVPGIAQAAPGGCSTSYAYADRLNGGYGYCQYGTGRYYVTIRCTHNGAYYNKYGPWVNVGQRSYAFCNYPGDPVTGRWLNFG